MSYQFCLFSYVCSRFQLYNLQNTNEYFTPQLAVLQQISVYCGVYIIENFNVCKPK